MKKLILSALALVIGANLMAQTPPAYPIHLSDSPSASQSVMPYTTIKVYLTVERETVLAGPYARYAQRYLGVMAPLADRTVYRTVSARLDYADPERTPEPIVVQQAAGERVVSHVAGGSGFVRAMPDKVSATDKSTEEMARDAANTIFALRRQRLEILTGDAGELYAGGLEATFTEMARMEDEYLALFLGKQTVTTGTVEIDVVPQQGKTNYIACRFTEQDGLLPESDFGGQPVVLTLVPEGGATPTAAAKADKRQMVQYRVADFCDCKLTYGQTELARRRIPVYQFGINITAPAK